MNALIGIVKRFAFIFGLALAVFAVGKSANAVMGVKPQDRAPIMNVRDGDQAMIAAHNKARATLGEFWASLERNAPNERKHALKVRFPLAGPGGATAEHIWVNSVTRTAPGIYAGQLDNIPKYASSFKAGQSVEFTDDMISDWMFMRSGKIVGNESMRPMLARMPLEKAERYRAMLETP